MILIEPIERINQQLIDHFGIETDSSNPIWRVVWAPDQLEKRLVTTTKEGLDLLTPIVQEVKKYRHISDRWVLERYVLVPDHQQHELAGVKKSYEPIYVFQDKNENYLPPAFFACKFAIDLIYAAQGHGNSNVAKYKDDWKNLSEEGRQARIKDLEDQLFGDESDLKLRTVTGEAIVVPQNYETTHNE